MFQVGDLVVGYSNNGYALTNEKSLCVVTGFIPDSSDPDDDITVALVMSTSRFAEELGKTYEVKSDRFFVCSPKDYWDNNVAVFRIANRFNLDVSSELTRCSFEKNNGRISSVTLLESSEDFTPEDSTLCNVLVKENFEPVVWSDAEIERMSEEAREALAEFENCEGNSYKYNPEVGKRIIRECNEAKGWLEKILSKHPQYNPKLHGIVLTEEYSRKPDEAVQEEFWNWVRERAYDNIPKEFLLDPHKVRKALRAYGRARDIVSFILTAPHHALVDYAGQDLYYWNQIRNENSWAYETYRTRRVNSSADTLFVNEEGQKWIEKVEAFFEGKSCFLSNERISEDGAKYFNVHYDISAQAGQKTSTIVRKVAKIIGLDKIHIPKTIEWTDDNGELHSKQKDIGWNYQFTKFCDAIKPCSVKRYTIISVNFMDYLFMSLGHKWSSCHTVDCTNVRGQADSEHHYHGMYSSGTISYALDDCTVEMYLVDSKYEGEHFELQERIKRCNFHVGNGKIVQGRVYPDGRDGSDSETDIAEQMRSIFQRVISECLEVPNYWTLKRGIRRCNEAVRTADGATNYPDYFNYDDCNVSYIGQPGAKKNMKKIEIGHPPICISCGKVHNNSGGIECEDCRNDYIARCAYCGSGISEDSDYVRCADNGQYYCDGDCAERDDVHYCEDDGCYHTEFNCYRDSWDCCWYSGDPEVETEDGKKYHSNENAELDGYVYVEYSDVWVYEDEIIKTADGTLFCNAEDAEDEGYVFREGTWMKAETEDNIDVA